MIVLIRIIHVRKQWCFGNRCAHSAYMLLIDGNFVDESIKHLYILVLACVVHDIVTFGSKIRMFHGIQNNV